MSRPTDKYRELLAKQRQEFQEKFDALFLSVEVILDNVDQVIKTKYQKPKKDGPKPNATEV